MRRMAPHAPAALGVDGARAPPSAGVARSLCRAPPPCSTPSPSRENAAGRGEVVVARVAAARVAVAGVAVAGVV